MASYRTVKFVKSKALKNLEFVAEKTADTQ